MASERADVALTPAQIALNGYLTRTEEIINHIATNLTQMNGDEMSRLTVELAAYYYSICGIHESIKADYLCRWTAIRKFYKSDRACDAFLLQANPSAKLYDRLGYTLRGIEKMLKSLDARIYVLTAQARVNPRQ